MFPTAPVASKCNAHYKSGQNWHNNNYLATHIYFGKSECIAISVFRVFGQAKFAYGKFDYKLGQIFLLPKLPQSLFQKVPKLTQK